MKRVLIIFITITLLAAALTGCITKKDDAASTPPLAATNGMSAVNEV